MFAAHLGWDRGYLYRRLSGETPVDMHDLDDIETRTRIRADYLVGGHEPKLNPPPPNGGNGLLLPRMDSNHQPSDYTLRFVLPADMFSIPGRIAA